MPANKTILAVAIGNSGNSKIIRDNSPATLAGVRPYIGGVIERLTAFGDRIGDANDYVIDYRECSAAQLNQNFTVTAGLPPSYVILGMSTTVMRAAATFSTTIPMIGIVSNQGGYGANVCGVSGQRPQNARRSYDKLLLTIPGLPRVHILHKPGYPPSDDSLRAIQNGGPLGVPVAVVPVAAPYGDAEIRAAIDGINTPGALLILPVDSFFAAADRIIGWAHANANRLPDFWPVTDWVRHALPSALGGYGASQHRCGQLLADKIHSIWESGGHIPNPRWTIITSQQNFSWHASVAAAHDLGVTLGNDPDMTRI
jgi:hypothetical protein